MIITCPCGDKKFNVDASLIPAEGRMLKCGFCEKKWHYKLNDKKLENENNKKEFKIKKINPDEQIPPVIDSIIKEAEKIDVKNLGDVMQKNNKISILNLFLLFLITFIAFIILLDTFKVQINNLIPGFNFLLGNFYESITDFYLFFKDLIR